MSTLEPSPDPGQPSAASPDRPRPPWYRPSGKRLLLTLLVSGLLGVGLGQLYLATAGDQGALAQQSPGNRSEPGQPVTEFPPVDRGDAVEVGGTTLTGDSLSLVDLRGQVVVVNVWGSWCPPCREEAPVLAKVSKEYAAKGVSFVGINVRDNRSSAVAFEDNYDITYPSIEDTDGRAVLALNQYIPANAVPVTLVLDREGRAAARVLGAVRDPTLRALLDSVVAER